MSDSPCRSNADPRLLLLGPIRVGSDPTLIGGTTISFTILIDFLRRRGTRFRIINTQRFRGGWRAALAFPYCVLKTLREVFWADIVLANLAENGTLFLAPALYLIARAARRPFALRIFGGNFVEIYESRGRMQRWILRKTVFRADLLLVQTKRVVDFLRPFGCNVDWLPTSRLRPTADSTPKPAFQRRFVFCSQIMQSKGIELVLEARKQLDESYTVDVYGPILEPRFENLRQCGFYKGIVGPKEVPPTLGSYDVLLLPTFHGGEGYPGIILEANSVGVPAIATRWLSLPEIIDDGKTGLLIPTHSVDALVAAIRSFNTENYPAFSHCAREKFNEFDSELVNDRLIEKLAAEARNGRRTIHPRV